MSRPRFNQETLAHTIDHIFLPPKLPQDGDINKSENDIAMLDFVHAVLVDFKPNLNVENPGAKMPEIRIDYVRQVLGKFIDLHRGGQLETGSLEREFKHMVANGIETIPLYIKEQNSGILVRKVGQEIVFQSFEVSAHNESVIGCQGRLLCSFPGPTIAIPTATFQDPAFQKELVLCLVEMSDSNPTDAAREMTRKAKAEMPEDRVTVKPIYITEFLSGLLRGIGRFVKEEDVDEVIKTNRICKRIADEVLWNKAKIPWRRSPYWLVLRVALQTTLLNVNAQAEDSTNQSLQYKQLMLYIMAMVLQETITHNQQYHVESDKLSHMWRKLGRRAAKLGQSNIPEALFGVVSRVIGATGAELTRRFTKIQSHSTPTLHWAPGSLDVQGDKQITFKESGQYIQNVLQEFQSPNTNTSLSTFGYTHPIRVHQLVAVTTLSNLSKTLLDNEKGSHEHRIALLDVEKWVEKSLDEFVLANISSITACKDLLELLRTYTSNAAMEYKRNPVDTSLMLLTAAHIWMAIDQIALSICPLLKEYSCEVGIDILEPLILPTETLLCRVQTIEQYIRSRESSQKPSVFVDGSKTLSTSFAVRYYQQSPEHQALLAEITANAQRERETKKEEFQRQKK